MADRADIECVGRIERRGRNQHRGHADQRVKRGDQLGHRGHRHPARDHRAHAAAEPHAENDQSPRADAGRRVRRKRGQHRNHHAGDAEHVAASARFRAGQSAQRQNEQDAGNQIKEALQISAHEWTPAARYFFFFVYIDSMRWVTRKPPKILTDANTSATKPKARAQIGPELVRDQ